MKKKVQSTSQQARRNLIMSGVHNSQLSIMYRWFKRYVTLTDERLSNLMNLPKSSISARRNDLIKLGIKIVPVGTLKSTITKTSILIWKLK